MKMTKVEQSVTAKRAPVVAFASGIDMGDSLGGEAFNAQLLSARVRATFEKARIIEAGAKLPSWKDAKALLALAKADGRIKFDRDDIERGIICRLDREYSGSGMSEAREWVKAHLALGLPNAESFHLMSAPARKSLANSATRKNAAAALSKLIGTRFSNTWRNALKNDARKSASRGSQETKTVQEIIAGAKVEKLTDRIKKAKDDGLEIPAEVIRAARTLVAWVEGKKVPKGPKPDTTATEVQA